MTITHTGFGATREAGAERHEGPSSLHSAAESPRAQPEPGKLEGALARATAPGRGSHTFQICRSREGGGSRRGGPGGPQPCPRGLRADERPCGPRGTNPSPSLRARELRVRRGSRPPRSVRTVGGQVSLGAAEPPRPLPLEGPRVGESGHPDYPALRSRPREARPQAFWPRGRRVCALWSVSGTRKGRGRAERAQSLLQPFPCVRLGVSWPRALRGDPPVLSNQPLGRRKAPPPGPSASPGRHRALGVGPPWVRGGGRPGLQATFAGRSSRGGRAG